MCLPKVNFEITLLSLTLYKTVTQHLTIPKNTHHRDFITLQQNFHSRKLYFQNFRIMPDTVCHVSRISWISPTGISMFDANDLGPKNYDYFSPQQLYKKSGDVRTLSCSIAFRQYTIQFHRGLIRGENNETSRIIPQTSYLFDARPKYNKTCLDDNFATRKFYVRELFL